MGRLFFVTRTGTGAINWNLLGCTGVPPVRAIEGLLIGFCDYPTAVTVDQPEQEISHNRVHANTSMDGGTRFSQPSPISEVLRWDGYTAIAVDKSNGPNRGRIYAAGHSQSSSPPGLRVQSSIDGVSWTPSASPNGRFHLVWIDTRDAKGLIETTLQTGSTNLRVCK